MSNLAKRVLAGTVGVPLILFLSYSGGIFFLAFSVTVSGIALWEFLTMTERKNYHPLKYSSVTLCALLSLSWYDNKNYLGLIEQVIIFFILVSTIEIFRKEKKNPMNILITLFGFVYITVPFILLYLLSDQSKFIVIFIFILIWSCDTAAYFGGKFFGKHQLSEISPKKTKEGSIIGFMFTVLIAILLHYIFPDILFLKDALITGLIVGIFSQVGDLFESLLKRYFEVKDSSGLIPGHGGVLDRFDSLIFVVPLIYVYYFFVK